LIKLGRANLEKGNGSETSREETTRERGQITNREEKHMKANLRDSNCWLD